VPFLPLGSLIWYVQYIYVYTSGSISNYNVTFGWPLISKSSNIGIWWSAVILGLKGAGFLSFQARRIWLRARESWQLKIQWMKCASTSHKSPHPMGFCENVPENTLQLCPGRISLARILHVVLVQQVVQRPEEGWHEVRWLRYTNSDELRLKSIPPLVSNNGGWHCGSLYKLLVIIQIQYIIYV